MAFCASLTDGSICSLVNYLAKTVDACRVGFLGVLSVAVEGGKGNELQEKVLEKNGRFGTINGAVNL